jgi:glycosyltransferase involved in cell wall biosynthesis
MKKLVSLLIPVFNEDLATLEGLEIAIEELRLHNSNYDFEVIIIDDSTEIDTRTHTRQFVRRHDYTTVIYFSRNFGKESALRAGMERARGDAIIPLDADLQDPFDMIPMMLERWEQGYSVVLAKRKSRKEDSYLKRITSSAFYKIIGRLSEVSIPNNVGDFRLMDKAVVQSVLLLNERNIFMKGIYAWVGYPTCTLEYVRPKRQFGKTKFPFRRLLRIALDGLVSFTSFPLRIWSAFGFLLAGISFIYSMYIIYMKVQQQVPIQGYASLVVICLFSTSLNLICFGIFGEYISRLFLESKARPHYIIQEVYSKKLERGSRG